MAAYNSCEQLVASLKRTRLVATTINIRNNNSGFKKVCLCETHDQSVVGEFEIQLNW